VRLEALCKELGVQLVAAAAFASQVPGRLRSLGSHPLRGLRGRMEVFVADDPADQPGG
jgi:class 3 adenylate cyclase